MSIQANQSVFGVLPERDFVDACRHLPWLPWSANEYEVYVEYVEANRDRIAQAGLRPNLVWMFADELLEWCENEQRSTEDETIWSAYLYHLIETEPNRVVPFVDGVREHLLRDQALATFEELVGGVDELFDARVEVFGQKAQSLLAEAAEQEGRYAFTAYALAPLDDKPVEAIITGEVGLRIEDGELLFESEIQEEALLALLACCYAATGGAVMVHHRDPYDGISQSSFVIESGQHRSAPYPGS